MKRPLALLVAVLVLAGAGALFFRHRAQVKEDQEDKAIIDFVYDEMIPRVAVEATRACALPSRDLVGVLHVSTADGGVHLGKLDSKTRPAGWTDETSACVDQRFAGFSLVPTKLKVPDGREYEVDVELTFPAPPMQ